MSANDYEIKRDDNKRGRLIGGLSFFVLSLAELVGHREDIIADGLIEFRVFHFEFGKEGALRHLQPLRKLKRPRNARRWRRTAGRVWPHLRA